MAIGIFLPATLILVITKDMLVEVDIGQKRPDTIHLEIEEEYLMLKEEVDIGLRSSTINPITKVKVLYCRLNQDIILAVMEDLDIGPIQATLTTKWEILGVMVQDGELCLKSSTTILCSLLDKVIDKYTVVLQLLGASCSS